MIDLESVREIAATYTKHGWLLRRVLLTTRSAKTLRASLESEFDNITISDSTIDAAWFSRPQKPGGVAWELRYLGMSQFALVEHANEDSDDFEDVLSEVEDRLMSAIAKKDAA